VIHSSSSTLGGSRNIPVPYPDSGRVPMDPGPTIPEAPLVAFGVLFFSVVWVWEAGRERARACASACSSVYRAASATLKNSKTYRRYVMIEYPAWVREGMCRGQ
jgi:hypothetical protein